MNLLSYFFNSNPIKQIDATALNKEKAKYFLIDVRQPEEYRQGHISGAKLIPLRQLATRMQELPAGREIVCVCHSGNRSKSAARKLSAALKMEISSSGNNLYSNQDYVDNGATPGSSPIPVDKPNRWGGIGGMLPDQPPPKT